MTYREGMGSCIWRLTEMNDERSIVEKSVKLLFSRLSNMTEYVNGV